MPARTKKATRKLDLKSFGSGLLAAIALNGKTAIHELDRIKLHTAFHEAFKVVEEGVGEKNLRFVIILDRTRGTSPDIDEIMADWCDFWLRINADGIWTIRMNKQIAKRILNEDVFGEEQVWLKAANAFIEHYK